MIKLESHILGNDNIHWVYSLPLRYSTTSLNNISLPLYHRTLFLQIYYNYIHIEYIGEGGNYNYDCNNRYY